MVLVSPVLGAMGAALAGTVWVALRVSRGSQGAGALATGIAGVGLSMRFVVVYPDPRLVDLLAYLGLSVGIGAVAARTTLRDVARVRPVTAWLADLRQRRPEPAP